jgi:hypothetical protein
MNNYYLKVITIPIIAVFLFTTSCSSVGKRDIITVENAAKVTKYDENDIESMVTYYFASRIRKDEDWKNVLPDSERWSEKMKISINIHNQTEFIEFQNKGFAENNHGAYVNVNFKIKNKRGKVKGGNDEVELKKSNDKWIISKVPI